MKSQQSEMSYETADTAHIRYEDSYIYDLAGNRKEKTYIEPGSPDATTYYFYNDLDQLEKETSDPAGVNVLVQYQYDNNGSLTGKIATEGTETTEFIYAYNLQNRLASVSVGGTTTTYKYNPDGIRVEKKVGSGNPRKYLNDPYNHTGYTQVFKETQAGANPVVYVIGSDVIAQATGSANPIYLLYDGQGSVRQTADSTGLVPSYHTYYYDGYGDALWFDPAADADTKLLYAGEMWDNHIKGYNLRTRDYRPDIGLFMTQDTFLGNYEDPISLHKYLYCHDNPINAIDPSGNMSLSETLTVAGIMTLLTSISGGMTTASVAYHIGEDKDFIPDALAVNIGAAGAYKGFTGGGTLTLMKDFKTTQWLYFVTGEGGLAPTTVFGKNQGFGWLLTFGFIWNMPEPSKMSGISTTATWPLALGRFAVPTTLRASRWAQIPLALARYKAGVYKNREGVIQFSQSASGPAEIAGGFWSYSFGWTVGYSSTPRSLGGLTGDVTDIVNKLVGALGGINSATPPETVENQMKSASAFISDSRD